MGDQYILVERGIPSVESDLPKIEHVTRSAIALRFWEHYFAFDATTTYRLAMLRTPDLPHVGAFRRLLEWLWLGSPLLRIETAWEPCGMYDKANLIQLVRVGLETDDDVIQQWFDAEDVMLLMNNARDFDEMALAVRAICGEHETDPEVWAYLSREASWGKK